MLTARGGVPRLRMLAFPRAPFLLALVVLTAFMAGCDARDFYNQNGTFHIHLVPQGPENSSLTDFRTLNLAIYGVTVRQVLSANPKEFSFGETPLVVNFIEAGLAGERIPLASGKQNLRAVESVTIRLDVVEATDAQGKDIPVCYEGRPVPSFPCFFMPSNNAFTLGEPQFAPPRGGTVTFGFPLAVKTAVQDGKTEYYLVGEAARATVDRER